MECFFGHLEEARGGSEHEQCHLIKLLCRTDFTYSTQLVCKGMQRCTKYRPQEGYDDLSSGPLIQRYDKYRWLWLRCTVAWHLDQNYWGVRSTKQMFIKVTPSLTCDAMYENNWEHLKEKTEAKCLLDKPIPLHLQTNSLSHTGGTHGCPRTQTVPVCRSRVSKSMLSNWRSVGRIDAIRCQRQLKALMSATDIDPLLEPLSPGIV